LFWGCVACFFGDGFVTSETYWGELVLTPDRSRGRVRFLGRRAIMAVGGKVKRLISQSEKEARSVDRQAVSRTPGRVTANMVTMARDHGRPFDASQTRGNLNAAVMAAQSAEAANTQAQRDAARRIAQYNAAAAARKRAMRTCAVAPAGKEGHHPIKAPLPRASATPTSSRVREPGRSNIYPLARKRLEERPETGTPDYYGFGYAMRQQARLGEKPRPGGAVDRLLRQQLMPSENS
jgi:hypothetical protein